MSDMDFLLWVRGPAFDIAVAVFCVGVVIRLLEILLLGRNQDFSEARASGMEAGLKTILTRSKIKKGMSSSYVFTQIIGYTFHLGFFVSLLFFIPHIELFRNLFGISWPGLPTPIVDLFAVLGIGALIGLGSSPHQSGAAVFVHTNRLHSVDSHFLALADRVYDLPSLVAAVSTNVGLAHSLCRTVAGRISLHQADARFHFIHGALV
jgi:hypothetical protein